jgi:hypothetical protein
MPAVDPGGEASVHEAAGPTPEADDWLPTPYTAQELRRSLLVGSYTLYRIEREGEPAYLERTTVVAADEAGCRMEAETWVEGDATSIRSSASTAGWGELRDHALFPADKAERVSVRGSFPTGTWDCWQYTVRDTAPTGAELERVLWFPLASPGSPARFEQRVDGRTVFRMDLLATNRGAAVDGSGIDTPTGG